MLDFFCMRKILLSLWKTKWIGGYSFAGSLFFENHLSFLKQANSEMCTQILLFFVFAAQYLKIKWNLWVRVLLDDKALMLLYFFLSLNKLLPKARKKCYYSTKEGKCPFHEVFLQAQAWREAVLPNYLSRVIGYYAKNFTCQTQ